MKLSFVSAAGLLALGALLSLPAAAQPSTGGPAPGNSAAVPLDGGSSLLLASGVAYGIRQLRAPAGPPRYQVRLGALSPASPGFLVLTGM